MDEKSETSITWMGKPIQEISYRELLEVVEWCVCEIEKLRAVHVKVDSQ